MDELQPRKRIFIIAGPNGAGKSTFATRFLPGEAQCDRFINADMIAAELSPADPESVALAAAKIMLTEMENCANQGISFAVETTLATRGYVRRIRHWHSLGYTVYLFSLRLPTVDLAIRRVALRVTHGGHNIPIDVIRRRYVAGWRNFANLYKPLVDGWQLYDTSGPAPVLVEEEG